MNIYSGLNGAVLFSKKPLEINNCLKNSTQPSKSSKLKSVSQKCVSIFPSNEYQKVHASIQETCKKIIQKLQTCKIKRL